MQTKKIIRISTKSMKRARQSLIFAQNLERLEALKEINKADKEFQTEIRNEYSNLKKQRQVIKCSLEYIIEKMDDALKIMEKFLDLP